MARNVRRVVTGHGPDGRSKVLLDEGELRLAAGDVVVQRGTNHAWINRSASVCRLGMVFIDAQEPAEIAALHSSRKGV